MTCDGLGKWRPREVMTLGVSVGGSDVFFLADEVIGFWWDQRDWWEIWEGDSSSSFKGLLWYRRPRLRASSVFRSRDSSLFRYSWRVRTWFGLQAQDIGHFFISVAGAVLLARCYNVGRGGSKWEVVSKVILRGRRSIRELGRCFERFLSWQSFWDVLGDCRHFWIWYSVIMSRGKCKASVASVFFSWQAQYYGDLDEKVAET